MGVERRPTMFKEVGVTSSMSRSANNLTYSGVCEIKDKVKQNRQESKPMHIDLLMQGLARI